MRIMILICLALISFGAYSQADRKFVRKGNGDYRDGQYQQAEVEYRKALEKDPTSFRADYNLGNALYKQKQFDAAAARYASLAENAEDKDDLNRYYYNLGNTLFESEKFKESVEAYKMALRNKPSDVDAKHNLQLALQKLTEQQQQQQSKDGEKNNDSKNQKNQPDKDQQNKDQQDPQQHEEDQQQQQQQKGQITPEDADRILKALENEEKEVLKKVQERKEQIRKVPVDKNW